MLQLGRLLLCGGAGTNEPALARLLVAALQRSDARPALTIVFREYQRLLAFFTWAPNAHFSHSVNAATLCYMPGQDTPRAVCPGDGR